MIAVLIILVILLSWTCVGVWWFISHLGDKYREDHWYDYVLLAPVMVILLPMSIFTKGK